MSMRRFGALPTMPSFGRYGSLSTNRNRKQRVIATVGRLDQLRESGQLDGLLQ